MEIQHLGAFGGFQGKAGPLVGHRVNGQNVITGVPYPSTKPATQPQLDARSIFRVLVDFQRPINEFLKVGFKHVKKETQSAFNYAFRENYNAVAKVFPFAINSGQCNQMDLATFLLYDEEADFFYVIVDAARRHEHMFFFDAPPNTLGHKLHGYMSYTAAEGKAQSDTMYAGWAIVEP